MSDRFASWLGLAITLGIPSIAAYGAVADILERIFQ